MSTSLDPSHGDSARDETRERLFVELERLEAANLETCTHEAIDSLARRFGFDQDELKSWTLARQTLAAINHSPPSRGEDQPPPDRLGGYELLGEIARGGMGVVYRARHEQLGREVALKVLRAGEGADPRQRERFKLEAQAAARLRHPNIVAIHDVGEEDGCPFIVLDLIEGDSLKDLLKRDGPLEPRVAAELCRKLALALHYAHQNMILHRDLKPANVLLAKARGGQGDLEPMLTDFGLAKLLDPDASSGPTISGQVVGTPSFMAPEQAGGLLTDARTDVYGLGATLYTLLVGEPPFVRETILEVLAQVASEDPEAPRRARPEIERNLETICLTCLEKEPERRYPSALALAEDLGRYLADETIEARPPSLVDKALKWSRRNRLTSRVLVASAAIIVLLAIGAGVWTARARSEARLALVGDARAAAEAAWAELQGFEGDDVDERSRLALRALQAAQRWRDLERGDPAAGVSQFRAAIALGEVALASKQWALANEAFTQARGLGIDEARARAALESVRSTRRATSERRRAEIEALLDRAESGALAEVPEGLRDAVFQLVRYPEPQTVDLLLRRLTAITRELLEVEATVLLETVEEGASRPLLAAALETRRTMTLGEVLPKDQQAAFSRALKRLPGRSLIVLAARQRKALGAGKLATARVCSEALGRLGLARVRVVAALARYLSAEADLLRAIPAGLALARLGGEQAQAVLTQAYAKYGANSSYGRQVLRAQNQRGVTPKVAQGSEDPEEYYDRAQARFAKGDLRGALADLDRAIELKADFARAWATRGGLYLSLRKPRRALTDYARALQLQPKLAGAWANRGNVYMHLRQYRRAIADYDQALELEASALFWVNRSSAHHALGDFAAAIRDANQALKLDAGYAQALVARGRAHRNRRQFKRALADFDAALELDPRAATIWVNRGNVYSSMDRYAKAIADYDQALELRPGFVLALVNRGVTRLNQKNHLGAVQDFNEVLRKVPTSLRALRGRSQAFAKLGRRKQAIRDLERFLKLAPNSRSAPHVRRTLTRLRAGG